MFSIQKTHPCFFPCFSTYSKSTPTDEVKWVWCILKKLPKRNTHQPVQLPGVPVFHCFGVHCLEALWRVGLCLEDLPAEQSSEVQRAENLKPRCRYVSLKCADMFYEPIKQANVLLMG